MCTERKLHSNWRSPADTTSLSPTVVADLRVRYSRHCSSPETFFFGKCIREPICSWWAAFVNRGFTVLCLHGSMHVICYLAQFLVWFVMVGMYTCNFIYDFTKTLHHDVPGNYSMLVHKLATVSPHVCVLSGLHGRTFVIGIMWWHYSCFCHNQGVSWLFW
jgi:hypothetical protein